MSSHVTVAGNLRDKLEQKYLKQKEERDNLCRYLAGWCGVAIARGSDPISVLDACQEAVQVCQDESKSKIVDQINDRTLEMQTLQKLIRSA